MRIRRLLIVFCMLLIVGALAYKFGLIAAILGSAITALLGYVAGIFRGIRLADEREAHHHHKLLELEEAKAPRIIGGGTKLLEG